MKLSSLFTDSSSHDLNFIKTSNNRPSLQRGGRYRLLHASMLEIDFANAGAFNIGSTIGILMGSLIFFFFLLNRQIYGK